MGFRKNNGVPPPFIRTSAYHRREKERSNIYCCFGAKLKVSRHVSICLYIFYLCPCVFYLFLSISSFFVSVFICIFLCVYPCCLSLSFLSLLLYFLVHMLLMCDVSMCVVSIILYIFVFMSSCAHVVWPTSFISLYFCSASVLMNNFHLSFCLKYY